MFTKQQRKTSSEDEDEGRPSVMPEVGDFGYFTLIQQSKFALEVPETAQNVN
jgi:hypothetical protein